MPADGVEPPSARERPQTAWEWLQWIRSTDYLPVALAREAIISIAIVVAIGSFLYLISGVWPPMVAVESGSMEPVMHRGDLIFLVAPGRYSPKTTTKDTGIVGYQLGNETGHRSFGDYGDVIVYDPPNRGGSPIIHRARFWVDKGERWVDRANPDYLGGRTTCEQVDYCPAPNAGFITKGDNNPNYDQIEISVPPVARGQVIGRAAIKIPWLGHVRLAWSGA